VQEKFAVKFPETAVTNGNSFSRLIEKFRETGSGLFRRSWTSLQTPFISAKRLSEHDL
jgi:hypothetical protein